MNHYFVPGNAMAVKAHPPSTAPGCMKGEESPQCIGSGRVIRSRMRVTRTSHRASTHRTNKSNRRIRCSIPFRRAAILSKACQLFSRLTGRTSFLLCVTWMLDLAMCRSPRLARLEGVGVTSPGQEDGATWQRPVRTTPSARQPRWTSRAVAGAR